MSSINTQPPVTLSGVTIGNVSLQDTSGNVVAVPTSGADGESNTSNRLGVSARLSGFNGNSWDRLRAGLMSATSSFLGMLNVIPFARYVATQPTLTDGQGNALQLDSAGNLRISLATLIAGEDLTNNVQKVEQRFSYAHVAAGQATTVIKSGAGFLHTITLNGAATATNVTTIYDNTAGSGTVIAIPAATTATVPTTLTYDVSFTTGLTILTATANGGDMTISYR